MNRWRLCAAVVVLVSLLAMGGCAPAAEPTSPAQPASPPAAEVVDLAGTSWSCYEFTVSTSPQTVLADAPITAEFSADGKLSGSSGVNTYSTTYTTEGTAITIDPQIVSTKMAGPQPAMDQESNYLLALPNAAKFSITETGDLVLLGASGNMIARYNPAE